LAEKTSGKVFTNPERPEESKLSLASLVFGRFWQDSSQIQEANLAEICQLGTPKLKSSRIPVQHSRSRCTAEQRQEQSRGEAAAEQSSAGAAAQQNRGSSTAEQRQKHSRAETEAQQSRGSRAEATVQQSRGSCITDSSLTITFASCMPTHR
jgi:hypothetical protein